MCSPHHAGSTPDICRSAVASSYQDFNGSVLSCLDVLCKVLVLYGEEKRREERGEKREERMAFCKFVHLLLYKYTVLAIVNKPNSLSLFYCVLINQEMRQH